MFARQIAVIAPDRLSAKTVWLLTTVLCLLMILATYPRWSPVFGAAWDMQTKWAATDFRAFYAAARLVLDGRSGELYNFEAIKATVKFATPYYNPPVIAYLWSPLAAFFSLSTAFRVMLAVNAVLLSLNCFLLWTIGRNLDLRLKCIILVGFIASEPAALTFVLGQYSLLLSASWAASGFLLLRRKDVWAGLALCPLLLKPEMLLPIGIILLLERRIRTLIPLAAVGLLAVLASLIMIGWNGLVDYPRYLAESPGIEHNVWMFGWNGLFARISGTGTAPSLLPLGVACSIACMILLMSEWRVGANGERFARQWLVLTIVTILADLHMYVEDLVIFMPAVVMYVDQISQRSEGSPRQAYVYLLALPWLMMISDPILYWLFTPYLIVVAALLLYRSEATPCHVADVIHRVC